MSAMSTTLAVTDQERGVETTTTVAVVAAALVGQDAEGLTARSLEGNRTGAVVP